VWSRNDAVNRPSLTTKAWRSTMRKLRSRESAASLYWARPHNGILSNSRIAHEQTSDQTKIDHEPAFLQPLSPHIPIHRGWLVLGGQIRSGPMVRAQRPTSHVRARRCAVARATQIQHFSLSTAASSTLSIDTRGPASSSSSLAAHSRGPYGFA
jgi:hypothetical protein